jgi:hypothetical protein
MLMKSRSHSLVVLATVVCLVGAAGSACSRQKEGERVESVSAQVYDSSGSPVRVASITPGNALHLAEGEYVQVGFEKYQGKAGGGDLWIEDGHLKHRNLLVTSP